MNRTKNKRKEARMDFRDDYDRESYIEVGHEPDKVDLGHSVRTHRPFPGIARSSQGPGQLDVLHTTYFPTRCG